MNKPNTKPLHKFANKQPEGMSAKELKAWMKRVYRDVAESEPIKTTERKY